MTMTTSIKRKNRTGTERRRRRRRRRRGDLRQLPFFFLHVVSRLLFGLNLVKGIRGRRGKRAETFEGQDPGADSEGRR
jgi:hypothetical protein